MVYKKMFWREGTNERSKAQGKVPGWERTDSVMGLKQKRWGAGSGR